MKKQKKYLPLMLAFAAMMSLLFVACSKDEDDEVKIEINDEPKNDDEEKGPIIGDRPDPDVMYGIICDDGYVPGNGSEYPIQVKSEGETVSLPIIMYRKWWTCSLDTPFPIYQDLLEKYPRSLEEWKILFEKKKTNVSKV